MYKQLEQIIKDKNPNIFDFYNLGIKKEQVEIELTELELNPIKGLIGLYAWYNGLNNWDIPTMYTSIFPFGVFAPFELAISSYLKLMNGSGIESGYFPILVDDHIFINLNTQMKEYGALFIHSPSLMINEPTKIFLSLESFVETQIECYKKGALGFNSNGEQIIEFEKLFDIGKKINLDCGYWE